MTDKRIFFALCEKPDYIFYLCLAMQVNSILLYPHTLIRNSSYCLLHNVYDVSLDI